MTEVYTNPTEDERKYLTPFEIGTDKFLLYGSPIVMSQRSELIKSLLPRLSLTDPNPIAPDQKVDQKVLTFLWEQLNGANKPLEDLSVDFLINLWPLYDIHSVHIYLN